MFGSINKRQLVPGQKQGNVHAVDSLHRRINRLFDDFWQDFLPTHNVLQHGMDFIPSIDIGETETELTVSVELPGVAEGDVDVTLEGGVLTISGEKKSEYEDDKDKKIHVIERSYGAFKREVNVGDNIDEAGVKAIFKNGVLTCHLPKKAPAKTKAKKIKVNKA